MTVSPDARPLAFADLDTAVRALREAGLRISTPRRLVLGALFDADGPVSASHLARELALDESSVYRNLEMLEQHGAVRHVHLGHSPGLYVLVIDDAVEYLYCERCARVTAVPPSRLDPIREQIRAAFGHDAHFTHFAIVGLCQACSERGERRAQADRQRHHHASGEDASADHAHLHSHGGYVHAHPH